MNHEMPKNVEAILKLFGGLADDKERYATIMLLMLDLFVQDDDDEQVTNRIDALVVHVKQMAAKINKEIDESVLKMLKTEGNA